VTASRRTTFRNSHPVGPWNLCLTHDPSLAGLYRAVNDFSAGLQAPILSFDDGRIDRRGLSATDQAHRIPCGGSLLFRDCHLLSGTAARLAAHLLGDADLLVVHSLFRAHVAWGRRWAQHHGKKYWIVPHGCLDPWGLRRRAVMKRLWLSLSGRRCLADADRVVFSSRRELEKARRWLANDNGVVVHWPVDIPDLTDRSERRFQFRTHYGIPSATRLLLYVGRLHTMKRPIETVRAFAAAGGSGSHLLMVGMDGDLSRSQVRAEIPDGVLERVHVVGELNGTALRDAMLASDAFISLSRRENFGYALCESLAYGLPVIVTPGHDILEELPTGPRGQLQCGWRLGDDGVASASAAIREMTSSDFAQLAAMGAAGRAWASASLSRDIFHDALSRLAH
jgi:glycosyltransferase involved in cell wall biosynthesis